MKHLFILKKLTIITIAIFFHSSAFSQHRKRHQPAPPVAAPVEQGSMDYLLACNGFEQLKLGADIKHLKLDKMAYLDGIDSLDTDSCYKFAYKDDSLLNMGNGLTLNLVGFRTYKNKIVNIYLFFQRDTGFDLLRKFEAEFGKFTATPGEFMYDWIGDGITLSLRYKQAVDMGVAIFTCNNIERQVKLDDVKREELKQHAADLLGAL